MSLKKPLGLFQAYGIELEYAIAGRESLSVEALADELIRDAVGAYECDAVIGELGWCNELVLHVLEIKTENPAASFDGLEEKYMTHIRRINSLLAPRGARLFPTGMHPWMNPRTETKLWPHENREIYETFDRIFDCRRHGWANLQSCQLNLPFSNDEEFGRLHAAIRFLLPIMPALAASTPVQEGSLTGLLDSRMEVYRTNAVKIPSIAGEVIPEPVFTIQDYREKLLPSLYRDIAPFDPEGTLQHEWINARGAIARFDRSAIEIRVLDSQECPGADLAISEGIAAVLQALVSGKISSYESQKEWESKDLAGILRDSIRDADQARLRHPRYLQCLGLNPKAGWTAGAAWQALIEKHLARTASTQRAHAILARIFEKGVLARRIITALGGDCSKKQLHRVYQELCDCLQAGELFRA